MTLKLHLLHSQQAQYMMLCPLGPALPPQNQYAITAADYHVPAYIYRQ
jgi:hypothetical protein